MALALATTPLAHLALAPPSIFGSQSSLLLLPRRASPAPVSLSHRRIIAAVATKEPELGGGGSGAGDGAGGSGGGSDPRGGGQEGDGEEEKMGQGLSMSQKLTLAYAALVGGNPFYLDPGVIRCKRDYDSLYELGSDINHYEPPKIVPMYSELP